MPREPMSFTPNQALVPDRDSLPLKKRDQRPSPPTPPPPQQQHQQECDATTFKAPFPYRSQSEFKTKHTSPFQPVPRRVPALYQPWMQTLTSPRSKPHVSAFREHHGWAEWRDFNSLQPRWDFSHHYQHPSHLSPAPVLHPGYQHHISRFSLPPEGFQRAGGAHSWEQLKTLREKSLSTDRQSNGRNKGPYLRRKERKAAYFPRIEKVNSPLLSTLIPQSAPEDFTLQHDLLLKSAKVAKHPGHSLIGVSPDHNSRNTYMSMKEDSSRSSGQASPSPSFSSSTSPNQFPWLLPHFVAGSLIELRDGRLRRVEHLQTEDFLLGSLACPDLCLSSCTVQSISPSSSSSISRLLILLHNQQSQELVDVYVEYPFFVRGRGWSSCSPQKTARLCGLQCRQLSVGDVCLALTPISAHRPLPSANLEPKTSPRILEGRCESLKAQHAQVSSEAGGKRKEAEAVRRRHYSAPELKGSRTNSL
ncbi:uncharacterized protein LOC117814048 [Notolabrus celidotus]|uniref:uncharacterized protein LOC117814048 n=1 Tax=Notolabrus celidotus TaxID=1203425 RepID=UPI001490071C|nr:uncharacterized protein LOC117814048 [Notolabrus celidotus]